MFYCLDVCLLIVLRCVPLFVSNYLYISVVDIVFCSALLFCWVFVLFCWCWFVCCCVTCWLFTLVWVDCLRFAGVVFLEFLCFNVLFVLVYVGIVDLASDGWVVVYVSLVFDCMWVLWIKVDFL